MDGPWAALGLAPGADQAAVRLAFRRLALENHPDKGGDPETFIRARAAYEELTQNREFWERQARDHERAKSERAGWKMDDEQWEWEARTQWQGTVRRMRATLKGGSYWEMPEDVLRAGEHDLKGLFAKQFGGGEKLTVTFRRADGSEVFTREYEGRMSSSKLPSEADPVEGPLSMLARHRRAAAAAMQQTYNPAIRDVRPSYAWTMLLRVAAADSDGFDPHVRVFSLLMAAEALVLAALAACYWLWRRSGKRRKRVKIH